MKAKKSKKLRYKEARSLQAELDSFLAKWEENGVEAKDLMFALGHAYLKAATNLGFSWTQAAYILIGATIQVSKTSEDLEKTEED